MPKGGKKLWMSEIGGEARGYLRVPGFIATTCPVCW
jgi:hypothetical protein